MTTETRTRIVCSCGNDRFQLVSDVQPVEVIDVVVDDAGVVTWERGNNEK